MPWWSERWGIGKYFIPKFPYDYEAELELAKSKRLPFINVKNYVEMTTIEGHNLELLASLIEEYGYVEDVKKILEAIKSEYKVD